MYLDEGCLDEVGLVEYRHNLENPLDVVMKIKVMSPFRAGLSKGYRPRSSPTKF